MTDSTKVVKDSDEGNVLPFLEYAINISTIKIQETKELDIKMKHIASAIRAVLWHYTKSLDDFDVAGVMISKKKEVSLISSERKLIQLKTFGLKELIMQYPNLKLPKIISWVEIIQIESMLRANEKKK